MLEIGGATAVITGGGSGIGAAMARHWVRNGGRVILADAVPAALERVKREIRAADDEVVTKVCDVTKEEDSAALASLAVERFGAINLVFPAAGIIRDGLMVAVDRDTGKVRKKMSLEQFRSVLDINVTGVFLTVRDCVEQMVKSDSRGLICLISSISSLGTVGQINYASSKAAMSVFPKVITAEFFRRGLSDRIRCVAVAPGYVDTPLLKGADQKALANALQEIPIGRFIEPDEVASLVSELYRNEAMAGEVYFIHGGVRLGSRG